MTVSNMGDINREIANRCRTSGLQLDCGADGLFNAEIAIIGEAPGEREKIMKLPLVGASGKYLWEQLRRLGITRRQVYISNVVKRQLRQAGDLKATISRGEVDHYTQILRWELSQLPNVRYVIVLGGYALEAVAGYSGIMSHRGSVYTSQIGTIDQGSRDVTVLAMLNPAAVLREPKWEIMFKFDVGRLERVLQGTYTPHIIDEVINPSPSEAILFIDRMQDEKLPCALDIETIGGETACIGLANNTHTGLCINFRDRTHNRFSIQDEMALRLRLQKWFDERGETKPRLVMQNGMFDSSWLAYKDRLLLPPSYFDTMLAHHTLYPSLPHNLGFLTSQYTEHPFYKDDGKAWREGGDIDDFWRYNVKDCCITLAVSQAELQELRAQKLDKFFFDHVMRLQPHLIRMTVGGVLVDVSLKQELAEAMAVDVMKLKEEFWRLAQEATGEDEDYKPNPGSPKQMAELYFRKLRLVGRGVATDKLNRDKMRQHPRTPEVAKDMLTAQDRWAEEQKFFSTYVEMGIDDDGRVRSEYKQTGVQSAPGRLSSAGTLWDSGGNLQNQPGRAQKMYIADPGYMFSYFDLTQAEAQVVGKKARIEKWNQQYAQARLDGVYDAHRALASEMFDIPYDDVPVYDWEPDNLTVPTKRYIAKRCRHGLNYRMGADRLAEVTKLPIRVAYDAHRIYHRAHPELQKWWDATGDEVRRTKSLYNAYGRRWILLERYDEEALKSIVAFYPQSTIGDKVSRCIYLCEDHPLWPKGEARILLNIHDALIAIHKPEHKDIVQRIMKEVAEEPLYIDGQELIISAEIKESYPDEKGVHRWSNMKKVKM